MNVPRSLEGSGTHDPESRQRPQASSGPSVDSAHGCRFGAQEKTSASGGEGVSGTPPAPPSEIKLRRPPTRATS